MSKIRANQITNENCNGAPTFTNGLNSSGIVTSTTTATIKPGRYVYDVVVSDSAGEVTRVVEGSVLVRQGVTR